MFNKGKKAEMGVGTLIVFIAMLLVAAIAAGVLIQTAGSLQEKSLLTGQQARAQISTNARVIEVSASDGRNSVLSEFQEIIKLSPGSDPIKLNQIIYTFNTKDSTATLKYRGAGGVCTKNNVNGYNTWILENITADVDNNNNNYTLAEDLDDDGADDYMFTTTDGGGGDDNLTFNLSTAGVFSIDLGDDIDGSISAITLSNVAVGNSTDTFAYVSLNGSHGGGATLNSSNADVEFTVTPYDEGDGYFVAIYEQEGTNHVEGNLQRGDIVRFCFESPGNIVEDQQVRLNFIPKIGTPTLTQFVSPDVIATERIYLYP